MMVWSYYTRGVRARGKGRRIDRPMRMVLESQKRDSRHVCPTSVLPTSDGCIGLLLRYGVDGHISDLELTRSAFQTGLHSLGARLSNLSITSLVKTHHHPVDHSTPSTKPDGSDSVPTSPVSDTPVLYGRRSSPSTVDHGDDSYSFCEPSSIVSTASYARFSSHR